MSRIAEIEFHCMRQGRLSLELNLAIGYLAEIVTLNLSRSVVRGDFRKLVVELVDDPPPSDAEFVDYGSVALVRVAYRDPAVLLGSEPSRRAAVLAFLVQAADLLRERNRAGLDEIVSMARRLWKQKPPYQWQLGKAPIRYGRWICRPAYVFGPTFSRIEVQLEAVGEEPVTLLVKEADRFWSLYPWFPAKKLVPTEAGIAFVDNLDQKVAFVPLTK
jgi:hypothetical protein